MDDNLFHMPGYNLYREDRLQRKGGGVAVWISTQFLVTCLNTIFHKPAFLDCIWLHFSDFIFCACYIPPGLSIANASLVLDYFSLSIDEFKLKFTNVKFIILGDFNNLTCSDLLTNHNLVNVVSNPTRNNAILDLILIDKNLLHGFIRCDIYPPLKTSDHNIVHMIGDVTYSPTGTMWQVTLFDYRESNLRRFYNILGGVDWSPLYSQSNDVEEKCNLFYDLLQQAIASIPKYTVTMTTKDKPWLTPLTKMLIQKRWDSYRDRNFTMFNHYKAKAEEEIAKAKTNFAKSKLRNRHGIWEVVNMYRCTTSQSVKPNDDINAESLNDFFTNIFHPQHDELEIPPSHQSNEPPWCPLLSPYEVHQLLSKLSIKGCGSDNLPSILLKYGADSLCNPICHLFNLSIIQKQVPLKWKLSKVIPIPKVQNPTISQFRPISLLPIVFKILEKYIFNHFYNTFLSHYGPNQFGFRKKSSTTCAALAITDDITKNLDDKQIRAVSLFSFDATKAFDSVPHNLLLRRLLDFNLPIGLILWLKQYLTDRRQFVYFNNTVSSITTVSSGVPQGASLSPALFCLFMAPLQANSASGTLYKYADDIALIFYHSSDIDDARNCRNEISNIVDWCQSNGITINNEKTHRILYSKGDFCPSNECFMDIPLDNSPIKILGFYFDSSLSWSTHITHQIKKVSKNLHLLRLLRPALNKQQLIHLYKALLQSILDYGSVIFVGSIKTVDQHRIQKTVSRAHRIICGANCSENCLENPDFRRTTLADKLFTKIRNTQDHILHNRIPDPLPSGRRLNVPQANSTRRINSFFHFMTIRHNSI